MEFVALVACLHTVLCFGLQSLYQLNPGGCLQSREVVTSAYVPSVASGAWEQMHVGTRCTHRCHPVQMTPHTHGKMPIYHGLGFKGLSQVHYGPEHSSILSS